MDKFIEKMKTTRILAAIGTASLALRYIICIY